MVVVKGLGDGWLTKGLLLVFLDSTPYSVFIPWITVSLQPKQLLSHHSVVALVFDLVLVVSVKQVLDMGVAAQRLKVIGTVVFG